MGKGEGRKEGGGGGGGEWRATITQNPYITDR